MHSARSLSRYTGILNAGLSPSPFLHRMIMSPALGLFWGIYSVFIKLHWKTQGTLKAGPESVFPIVKIKKERFKGASKPKALTQPELLWSATPEYKQHLRSGILICLCEKHEVIPEGCQEPGRCYSHSPVVLRQTDYLSAEFAEPLFITCQDWLLTLGTMTSLSFLC